MKRITEDKSNKRKKRKNKIIIIIILIIVFVISIRLVPRVKTVDIIINSSNNENLKISKEQILELSEIKIGDRLYKYLRSDIAKKIENNPYVEKVNISRNISGNISIEIFQREPSYLINYDGDYIYIDEKGYALEINSQKIELPIIIGLTTDFSTLNIGEYKNRLNQDDLEKIKVINSIIWSLNSNLVENKISSIDISDKKDIILNLEEDRKEVYLGDGTDINTKVLYMKKILETEAENSGKIFVNGNLDDGYVYFKEQ